MLQSVQGYKCLYQLKERGKSQMFIKMVRFSLMQFKMVKSKCISLLSVLLDIAWKIYRPGNISFLYVYTALGKIAPWILGTTTTMQVKTNFLNVPCQADVLEMRQSKIVKMF